MKITPKTKNRKMVDFADLKPKDTFYWHGGIWIKIDDNEQGIANLETGEYQISMCGELVVPVDAVLTWKYKQSKKEKKLISTTLN